MKRTYLAAFFSLALCLARDASGATFTVTNINDDTTITTDNAGNAGFNVNLPVALAASQVLTATATDPDNNTSEFSPAVAVTSISACSLIVTTTNDGGPGSLRAAIQCANNTPGLDTIIVPAGVYTLTIAGGGEEAAATGDLDIAESLTLVGAGASTTIIDANGLDRAFHVLGAGTHVTISGMTIRNGRPPANQDGGGILMDSAGGLLELERVVLTANSLTSGNGRGGGGAVAVRNGSVTISGTTISGNTALGSANGGGIFNASLGQLLLVDSVVSSNTADFAGGIYVFSFGGTGDLIITNSVFLNNRTTGDGGDGGAIFYDSQASRLLISSSIFSNNVATGDGGAVEFNPPRGTTNRFFSITDTTFVANRAGAEGGGFYVCCSEIEGSILNTTFVENLAGDDGGGLYTCCSGINVTITNSTFSANTATKTSGGAIEAEGDVVLINVTVAENSAPEGGGVFNDSSVTLKNTIIANSRAGGNLAGEPFTSSGHNLSSDNSGSSSLSGVGDLVGSDPRLGPLADNGGRTLTQALLLGSPAIDAGDNAGAPPADQRGISRPQGSAVDIGAFEFVGEVPVLVVDLSVTLQDNPDPVTVGSNLVYNVIVSNNGAAMATGVLVTNTLPPSVTFVSASQGVAPVQGVLVFAIGKLAAASSSNLAIEVIPTAAGVINNSVIVAGAETDPNLLNNVATASTTVSATPLCSLVVVNTNDSGPGSLRAAIDCANSIPGRDTISFNIPGPGVHSIAPASDLPTIIDPVIIDGYTQPGSRANTLRNGNDAILLIELNGTQVTGPGLTLSAGDSTVRGLVINQFHVEGLRIGSNGNRIEGNYIGTDPSGTKALGNGGVGILVQGSGNQIGNTSSTGGNIIAFNAEDGIFAESTGSAAFLANSIFANGGLGIDLAPDAVNPNDLADADRGANNLQNFPVLTSAVSAAGGSKIQGTLNSTPSQSFILEFFANRECDPSGFGEGETFLGRTTVTTDSNGNAAIDTTLSTRVPGGQFITSTATDPDGNTSEFSQCIAVEGPTIKLSADVLSPLELNRQTGLFEQTIRLSNLSTTAVSAARVFVQGLSTRTQLYNATGSSNNVPFIALNQALASGQSVDFLLEYYFPDRVPISDLSFTAEEILVAPNLAIVGNALSIDRNIQVRDGRFLIEFTAVPGRTYSIQYSPDLQNWSTVIPSILAPANRVQWLDDGPPKTESKPTQLGSRFYRVIELP